MTQDILANRSTLEANSNGWHSTNRPLLRSASSAAELLQAVIIAQSHSRAPRCGDKASKGDAVKLRDSFLARVKATEYAQYVHACSQSQSSFWSYDLGNRLVCVPVYGDVASRESDIRDYVESIGWIFLAGSVHSYTRSYSRRNRSWFFGWLDAMQRGNRELIVEDIRDAFMPRPTRKDRATSAYDIPQQDKDEIRWWTRRARYTHPPRALSYACRIINLCLSESLDYGAGDDRWIATCKTILDDSLLHAVGLNEDALEDCWRLYE